MKHKNGTNKQKQNKNNRAGKNAIRGVPGQNPKP
jgi:hypothetical protein